MEKYYIITWSSGTVSRTWKSHREPIYPYPDESIIEFISSDDNQKVKITPPYIIEEVESKRYS